MSAGLLFSDCEQCIQTNAAYGGTFRTHFRPFNVLDNSPDKVTFAYPFTRYAYFHQDYDGFEPFSGWIRKGGPDGTEWETGGGGIGDSALKDLWPETFAAEVIVEETPTYRRIVLEDETTIIQQLAEPIETTPIIDSMDASIPWTDPMFYDLAHNLIAEFSYDPVLKVWTSVGPSALAACDLWRYIGNHTESSNVSVGLMRLSRSALVYHFARSSALTTVVGCRDFGSDTPFAGPIAAPVGTTIKPPTATSIHAAGGTHGYAAVDLSNLCF